MRINMRGHLWVTLSIMFFGLSGLANPVYSKSLSASGNSGKAITSAVLVADHHGRHDSGHRDRGRHFGYRNRDHDRWGQLYGRRDRDDHYYRNRGYHYPYGYYGYPYYYGYNPHGYYYPYSYPYEPNRGHFGAFLRLW